MPVGTLGTVKSLSQEDLERIGAQIVLGNTYHLYLRPGTDILEQAGGLHRFMNWQKPILTDSGGYQVFSLAERRKISEQGVTFSSHIDGSRHEFSPENAVDIQRSIGADIFMAFDECPPWPAKESYVKESMELTHRWLDRCRKQMDATVSYYGHEQTLFPIIQGGTFPALRIESARICNDFGEHGVAIGGLSVGEPTDLLYEMTSLSCSKISDNKARYLMGVGTPANILECIDRGVDMFDCVMPSRNARNGMLFTWEGIINVRNEKWKWDHRPIDHNSLLIEDRAYSFAYLSHLFRAGEMLGPRLATIHNLNFYLDLVKKSREAIIKDEFSSFKNSVLEKISRRL